MKAKTLIFITLVFGIVLIGVLATIFLLASTPVITDQKPPVSNPVSSADGNVIDLNQGNVTNFDIAVINPEDTIDLKNNDGQRIPIQLAKMSWKDLNWSPDGKLLAVLGKTSENIFDLFVFNTEKKSWTTSTSFNKSTLGIDSYVWRDSNVILFTQGITGEHWIHQYVYNSGEITKLQKTEGKIQLLAPDASSMVVKLNDNNDSTSFAFYKPDATLIYNLNKVTDSSNQPLLVSNVIYTKSANNIILRTTNGKVYSHTFGNSNAIELVNGLNSIPMCAVTEKVFLGLKENSLENGDHYVEMDTISIENNTKTTVATITQDANRVDFSASKCYKVSNMALNLGGNWYLSKDSNFFSFFAIRNAVEVSFRNLNN